MKSTISKLLETYENGKLSRRDLVQGLALLAAALVRCRRRDSKETVSITSLCTSAICNDRPISTNACWVAL